MNYDELGFKCGIEIHQQLEGKKLFCNCPTVIRKDKPDFEITRKLRASAGETGVVDKAASHEARKDKHFVYRGYEETTCLLEVDEEPPREVNQDALTTALEVAKMLNCKIVDEIQFMRKTVIDGSNTSGFQRTALVGIDGYVEVDGKRVGVPTLCLEEEACQVIKRTEDCDVYNLSRLGIPLVEIATDPDIFSAEEAEKVAGKLGMILRSTGKMKRGIGTIRQDVNLSVKGGNRIEIKGFQDLKSIPRVIENEVKRQLAILESGKKIVSEVRKAEPDFTTSFLRPMPGAARMYPETDVPRIIPIIDNLKEHKLLDEKSKEWEKSYKIPTDLAVQLVKRDVDFDSYVKLYPNIIPKAIATHLTSTVIEIRRRLKKELSEEELKPVLEAANEGKVPIDAILPLLEGFVQSGKYDFSSYEGVSEDELRKELAKIVEENKGAPMGALMGKAMIKFRGKAEGKKIMQILKDLL